jgi:hypothetical protein
MTRSTTPEGIGKFIFGSYKNAVRLAFYLQEMGFLAVPRLYQLRGWIVVCAEPSPGAILDRTEEGAASTSKTPPLNSKAKAGAAGHRLR